MNDMWRMDGGTGRFHCVATTGQPPSPRRGMGLVYDSKDSLIVFGGMYSGGMDATLAVFSVSRREWRTPRQLGSVPSARTNASLVLLAPNQLLLFGGCNASGVFHNDAYVLDTSTTTWHALPALNMTPAPRYHHRCACTRRARQPVRPAGVPCLAKSFGQEGIRFDCIREGGGCV
eukprot:361235-Chlamydomonas_euryale.AAC.7